MGTVAKPVALDDDDIVLSHFTLGRHHDIVARLDAAAAAGCQAIGIYTGDFRRLEDEGSSDVLGDLLDARGLCIAEIDALRPWGHPSSAAPTDPDDEATAFRIARQFECRSVHVLGPYTGTFTDAVSTFGALCDRAADVGLLVGLEFMPTTNIATATDALRIVEAAGRSNGGICIDVWHHQRGANELELIRALPGAVVVDVQLSDGPARPRGSDYDDETRRHRLAPGDGDWDLTAFVEAVRATGARVPWSIEVCNEDAWDTDGAEFVARCAAGVQRVVGTTAAPSAESGGATRRDRGQS